MEPMCVSFKKNQPVRFPCKCCGCLSDDTSASIKLDYGHRQLHVEEGTGSKVGRVMGYGLLGGILGGIIGSAVGASVGKGDKYNVGKNKYDLPLCPICRQKLSATDVIALCDIADDDPNSRSPVVTKIVSRAIDGDNAILRFENTTFGELFCRENGRRVQPSATDDVFKQSPDYASQAHLPPKPGFCPQCGAEADQYKEFRLGPDTVHKCTRCGYKDYE